MSLTHDFRKRSIVTGPLRSDKGTTIANLPYDTGAEVVVCGRPEAEVTADVLYKTQTEKGPTKPGPCPAPPDTIIKHYAEAVMTARGKVPEGSAWQIKNVEGLLNGARVGSQGSGTLTVTQKVQTGDYTFTGRIDAENDGNAMTAEKSTSFHVQVPPDEVQSGGPAPKCDGPPPPPPPDPCTNSCGHGHSSGDPHLTTFDNYGYDFQGVGEFVLSRTADRAFEVQARYKRAGDRASSNAAVAMNVNGDRVGVYALGAAAGSNGGVGLLKVNGQDYPYTMSYKTSIRLPRGGVVNIDGMGGSTAFVYVYWPDGSYVQIANHPEVIGFVNVYVSSNHRGRLQGLLGNFDDGPGNDLIGRDGVSYPSPTFEQLYKAYGQSWRVQQAESLFDYAPGQSTESFADLNFPPAPVILEPAALQQAETTCQQAGVVGADTLRNCAYDVAVTSSATWAQNAAAASPVQPRASITPAGFSATTGQQQDLRATVTGDASSAEVVWSASGGTITPGANGLATYRAPNVPGEYTITATLRGLQSTARVTVYSPTLQVPAEISVFEGQSSQLTATLLGYTGRALRWNASGGTVTPQSETTATFTAPSTSGEYTVTVSFQDDPSITARTVVHVLPPQLNLAPSAVTVEPEEVVGLNATLSGLSNGDDIDWQASGGQLIAGLGAARFTAPFTPGTYTVTATLRSRAEVRAQAVISVPSLHPTLHGSWGAEEAVMFTGQRVALQGEGLRPERARWTATGGDLSVASGNAVEYTAPPAPGEYTVTYAHASSGQVKAEVRVRVIQPQLALDPATTTVDVGQTVTLQAKNVPAYYCQLLRAPVGSLAGCTLSYSPQRPGANSVGVTLDGVPEATATAQVQGFLFSLAFPGGQSHVHAGERLRVRAAGLTGAAFSQPIEWSATGGQTVSLGNGEAEFTAAEQAGEYRITAHASAFPETPMDIIANVDLTAPVLRFTNDGTNPIVPAGQSVALRALKVGGGVYPVPLVWEAVGGTVAPQADGTALFTAGDVPGNYSVTAHPRYGANLKAEAPLRVVQHITGETRFLLTWGASPSDLDIHLWLPASTPYHVYYRRRGTDATCPYAQLDQDVTDGFGPEIMRVRRLTGSQGVYYLQVYNYSGDGTFTSAGAKVDVVGEDGKVITTVTAPADGAPGSWWRVLSFDAATGVINVINQVNDGLEPYYDTGSGCSAPPAVTSNATLQSQRAQPQLRDGERGQGASPASKPAWIPGVSNLRR